MIKCGKVKTNWTSGSVIILERCDTSGKIVNGGQVAIYARPDRRTISLEKPITPDHVVFYEDNEEKSTPVLVGDRLINGD